MQCTFIELLLYAREVGIWGKCPGLRGFDFTAQPTTPTYGPLPEYVQLG